MDSAQHQEPMEDMRETIGIEELLRILGTVGVLHPDSNVATGANPEAALGTVFDRHYRKDRKQHEPGHSLLHRANDSGLND